MYIPGIYNFPLESLESHKIPAISRSINTESMKWIGRAFIIERQIQFNPHTVQRILRKALSIAFGC